MDDLENVMKEILDFRDERNWASFHTPKNLAAAIATEAGELQDTMLWKSDEEVQQILHSSAGKHLVESELADVLIFALLCCYATNVDPIHAITTKLAENRKKYPIDQTWNNATKYSHLK